MASLLPALPSVDSRKRRISPKLIVGVLLIVGLAWVLARHRTGIDWGSLPAQLRSVSWLLVLSGVGCIGVGYLLRAWRWSVLLRPMHPTRPMQLLPSQLIGFTISGLLGRFADLGRPYIVARSLGTPVTLQVAVYSVERVFDLGAAALIFSATLAFAPASLPHHEALARAGLLSLAATLLVAGFAVAVRLRGEVLAAWLERRLTRFSPGFARRAGARLLEFQAGLAVLATAKEFLLAAGLSLVMWMGIAMAYLTSARAFRGEPTLAGFSLPQTMLLMATGIGGSAFQLPVLGWFTQVALLSAALHTLFGVPVPSATACGFVILAVCNLSVIPVGLVLARREGIGLREATRSKQTTEEGEGL